jgi:hypothetical protein
MAPDIGVLLVRACRIAASRRDRFFDRHPSPPAIVGCKYHQNLNGAYNRMPFGKICTEIPALTLICASRSKYGHQGVLP